MSPWLALMPGLCLLVIVGPCPDYFHRINRGSDTPGKWWLTYCFY